MKTPVAIFLFKRDKTLPRIFSVLRKVRPPRIYLISDAGRNENEQKIVDTVRQIAEKEIDWECEVIKDYALSNRGVFENIGMGALRVFNHEDRAIFIEDDNLPAVSFFEYCEELLDFFEKEERILWICGTNYYQNMPVVNSYQYFYTQQLLPCGWASWREKFVKYYDKDLTLLKSTKAMELFKNSYSNSKLYEQQLNDILSEKRRNEKGEKYISWDYHMLLSLRAQNLFGIAPINNQIENIGVDEESIHGGSSTQQIMTRRFCGVPTALLNFPLKKCPSIEVDSQADRLLTKKILYPFSLRVKIKILYYIKKTLDIEEDTPLIVGIQNRLKKLR